MHETSDPNRTGPDQLEPAEVASQQDAEPYLAEARIAANLDHPNTVPVHDVGTSEESPFS
jgi:hypothetical protein